MKAYIATTGIIFALLFIAHVARTIDEWHRLAADPGFIIEGPGIGVIAGGLCFWAWRLIRVAPRS